MNPDEVIARNDDRLRRVARGQAQRVALARRRQRSLHRAGVRAKRAGAVALAVIVGLIVWGWMVGGLGIGTFMMAILLGGIAIIVAALTGGGEPALADVAEAPPAALPRATEVWLDRKRTQLPLLAAPAVDAIAARLAMLEPQLATVPAADPVAQDLNRLLGKHLPELVERYTRVPPDQRARTIEGDGRTLEASLVDGLGVIETELARASERLAQADRDAFVVQGKFLESRYQEPSA